jgi:hypothetical protein
MVRSAELRLQNESDMELTFSAEFAALHASVEPETFTVQRGQGAVLCVTPTRFGTA